MAIAATIVGLACGDGRGAAGGSGGAAGPASGGTSGAGGSTAAGGSSGERTGGHGGVGLGGGGGTGADGARIGGADPGGSGGVGGPGTGALGSGGTGGPPPGDGGQAIGGGGMGGYGFETGGSSGMPSGGSGGWAAGGTGAGPSGGSPTGGAGGDPSGGSGGQVVGGAGTGASGGGGTGGTGGDGGTGGTDDDLCDVGVWDGSAPQPLPLSGNTFAHDPTMIEANGIYYRFWTGDFIPSATSEDLRHWSDAPTVYGNRYPAWSASWLAGIPNESFGFPWAPDVSFFHGQYHIYSTFSAIFGDNVSCITHLTTSDLGTGNWTDHEPVICTEGLESYNAIDADLGLDFDGDAYLAFGSFWDGIMMIPLDADGRRAGDEMTRLAWASEIEGPVLFRRCGHYYLFVSWGLCCPGEGRSVDQLTYRVAVGRATDIRGPYLDRDGRSMLDGGGTVLVEGDHITWAAAGHSDVLVSGDKIYHLFHAYRQSDGGAQLRIVELPFDDEGWPVPGGP
ncbi:MAG: arabinan endo-1,5-alpha-L-arabinosidase [Polyangiaceae bacterium]|nr:arabinan endo-1,5-alpha-L-arabinosidase [Polyangiaceae bacterium]